MFTVVRNMFAYVSVMFDCFLHYKYMIQELDESLPRGGGECNKYYKPKINSNMCHGNLLPNCQKAMNLALRSSLLLHQPVAIH